MPKVGPAHGASTPRVRRAVAQLDKRGETVTQKIKGVLKDELKVLKDELKGEAKDAIKGATKDQIKSALKDFMPSAHACNLTCMHAHVTRRQHATARRVPREHAARALG